MYKKTGDSHHYLPRTGSYSTVPHRNGRVDVLPPGSSESLYDTAKQISDARGRLEVLRLQRERLVNDSHSARRFDQLREKLSSAEISPSKVRMGIDANVKAIDKEIAELKKHVGALTSLLAGGGVATFEQAFERVAKVELSTDVYNALAQKAQRVLVAARPEKGKLSADPLLSRSVRR